MKVFVEIQNGSSFEIEVDHLDTMLEVKHKINNSQRIPVSQQTLFFDGVALGDYLDLEQCQIFHESHLQLVVSPDHNPNHNQTEQSPPSSNSIIDGHQAPTVTVQTEQSPPSKPTEQIIDGHQDSTVTAQVLQTELSPSSNSVKEITNIQGSSVKPKELTRKKRMVVHVWLYSGEIRAPTGNQVAVNVKTKDNVKELRNELVKIQESGELNLPQEGYLLTHKNRLLNENMSFWDECVDHNDTIEILPLHLTSYTMDNKFLLLYI